MPVNRPLPVMRDRPTAMPEASRWMLSGSSAVVATRSMRPRSIGSTIPLFSPRMRRRLGPRTSASFTSNVNSFGLTASVAVPCTSRSTRPQVRSSKVASIPSRRALAIENSARLGFDGFLRTLRGMLSNAARNPILFSPFMRA